MGLLKSADDEGVRLRATKTVLDILRGFSVMLGGS